MRGMIFFLAIMLVALFLALMKCEGYEVAQAPSPTPPPAIVVIDTTHTLMEKSASQKSGTTSAPRKKRKSRPMHDNCGRSHTSAPTPDRDILADTVN